LAADHRTTAPAPPPTAPPPGAPNGNLAATVQEISERASLLVREEIELARAEMTEKLTKLAKGAAVGAAAGIFAIVGLLFLLHGLAWLAWYELPVNDQSFFWGFFLVAAVLFILGGLAGFLAARYFRKGSPPTPKMAIDEAKKTKETLT
jgi:uncharacterized membrane protein YqjE